MSTDQIPPQAETVYAHVERTVHRLLDEIHREATARVNSPDWAAPIKHLADAVQALSSWPQFDPMNAVDDYRKIAECEVGKALRSALGSKEAP